MLDILEKLQECWENQTCAAIATIIHKQGSTYRGIGAKSVILPDGTILGTLSGGCVEGDIYEHAKNVIDSGIPQMKVYDFHGEGDLPWGLGVGCNGALKIWIEPFDPIRQQREAKQILDMMRHQLPTATIIASDQPERYSIGTKIVVGHTQTDLPIPAAAGLFTVTHNGVRLELYVEKLKPIPRLIIFGAGPDVVPLVRGAKLLQWLVTIVDHRPGYANQDRFPEADEILVSPIGTVPTQLVVHEKDYAVIMTHHFQQDRLFLQHMLSHSLSYLGILGPKNRTEQLLGEITLPEGVTLHSPIGLDIKAETPEEIAISILSEIICHVNGGTGAPLKNRVGPIHDQGGSNDRDHRVGGRSFPENGTAQTAAPME
jgi:xanthine/CO dehydrogenase XdhC/CoxF family maturation factor